MPYSTDYNLLSRQMSALTEDVPYPIANLSNAAALLWEILPDINWAGFYILEKNELILGPFQGKPACVRIPMGKGVCGTAAATGTPQLVPDVHQFPGHIACDSASRSEIVIPIYKAGKLYGVLDIDSPSLNRFADSDLQGHSQVVKVLEKAI